MRNLPLCILIALFIAIGLMMTLRENFSTSGLTISDDYCSKLTNIYLDPHNNDQQYRHAFSEKVCGNKRRHMIYPKTGNYYTENGVLI